MKQFRHILSLFFALLVLFSSSSFIIGLHLCDGDVQNMALFTKADECEKDEKLPPCHRHEAVPCCQDETIIHDAQGFRGNIAQISIAKAPVIDIVQPPVLIAEVIPSATILKVSYYNYDPPLRSSDLTVDFQVFLI